MFLVGQGCCKPRVFLQLLDCSAVLAATYETTTRHVKGTSPTTGDARPVKNFKILHGVCNQFIMSMLDIMKAALRCGENLHFCCSIFHYFRIAKVYKVGEMKIIGDFQFLRTHTSHTTNTKAVLFIL